MNTENPNGAYVGSTVIREVPTEQLRGTKFDLEGPA